MQVLIIGAGIGGLTTAIALQQRGVDVQVFESASTFGEVGAGLWIAPNALQILDRLGLAEAINDLGRPYEKGAAIVRLNGTVLTATSAGRDVATYDFNTVAIHRARLHEILLRSVNQATSGKRFISFEPSDQGVIVNFEDGTSARGDLLIGADGLHSHVRNQLLGKVSLRYSGQTCWRFLTPTIKSSLHDPYDMTEMWGDVGGLRVGSGAVSDHLAYTFITAKAPQGVSLDPDTVKTELRQLCRGYPHSTLDLIDQASEGAVLRNDLCDIAPLPIWYGNRVVLVGDAAHATLPNLGQGACQAIESAYSLAMHLSRVRTATDSNLRAAFDKYQNERMPKAHRVTKMSWQLGQLSNLDNPVARRLRDLSFRLTPSVVNRRVQDQLYRVAPEAITTPEPGSENQ